MRNGNGNRHRRGGRLTPRALAPPSAHSSRGVAGAVRPLTMAHPGRGGQGRPPLRVKRKPTQPMGTVIAPAAGERALHEAPLRRNGQSDKNTVGAIHESPASAVTTTTAGRVDGKRRQYHRRGRRPRRPGHGIGHRPGWSSPPSSVSFADTFSPRRRRERLLLSGHGRSRAPPLRIVVVPGCRLSGHGGRNAVLAAHAGAALRIGRVISP